MVEVTWYKVINLLSSCSFIICERENDSLLQKAFFAEEKYRETIQRLERRGCKLLTMGSDTRSKVGGGGFV